MRSISNESAFTAEVHGSEITPIPRGATLFELIIGVALLAIAAAGFFRLYSLGIAAGQHAERLAIAVGLAQAQMEGLISDPKPLKVREVSYEPAPVTRYRVRFEGVEETTGLWRASTTVLWTWQGRARQTSVTTLIAESSSP